MQICSAKDSRRVGSTEVKPKLLVYPNPAQEMVTIEIPTEYIQSDAVVTINLANTFGQIVRSKIITGNTIKAELDVAKLASGVYICSILKNGKRFLHRKIVVSQY